MTSSASEELKAPGVPPKPSDDPFSIIAWCVAVLTTVCTIIKSFIKEIVDIFKKCKCDKKDDKKDK